MKQTGAFQVTLDQVFMVSFDHNFGTIENVMILMEHLLDTQGLLVGSGVALLSRIFNLREKKATGLSS